MNKPTYCYLVHFFNMQESHHHAAYIQKILTSCHFTNAMISYQTKIQQETHWKFNIVLDKQQWACKRNFPCNENFQGGLSLLQAWLDPHCQLSHCSAPRRSDWIIGIFQPGTKWRTAKRKAQLDTTCHRSRQYGCFQQYGYPKMDGL